MGKVNVKIKYGHGIKSLNCDFNFNSSVQTNGDTHIIYAQNGVMKSSFAKTLQDYASNVDIKDHIFNIPGSCAVYCDGVSINKSNIFSVPSFDNSIFDSCENMGSLLVDEPLKKKYDELTMGYGLALTELLNRLKIVSGVKKTVNADDIVKEFCLSFGPSTKISRSNFVALLKKTRKEICESDDFIADIPYSVAGEQYVVDFAKNNGNFLAEFIQEYDELLRTSAYMRGEFSTRGADEVVRVLDKQKFFTAEHSVVLVDESNPSKKIERRVGDAEELKNLFEGDFDRVFTKNPGLKIKFKKILSKLNQVNHSELRNLLENHGTRRIIILMANSSQLRKKLWLGYLKQCSNEIDKLISIYKKIMPKIKEIVKKSGDERTDWDAVVGVFNRRFRHMPFELKIDNRSSVILQSNKEVVLQYYYKHDGDSVPIQRDDLLESLSTGERKAFYLLNILFEIYIRKKSGKQHLIILDDIVDSFDYKNKYAFLEYIYEISKDSNNLKLIVLTHNFDFFRLLQSRMFGCKGKRDHAWFAERTGNGDVALREAGQFNYYENTRDCAERDCVAWLSLIPLARNLVEYRCDNTTNQLYFEKLTECMHSFGVDTTVGDVRPIIQEQTGVSIAPYKDGDLIQDKIFYAADNIPEPSAKNLLHNKTVLALACRLRAEDYMKTKLGPGEISEARLSGHFTRNLYDLLSSAHIVDDATLSVLEEVNLMTPEDIHINAFMYEPIIDMSQDELADLYDRLKRLK